MVDLTLQTLNMNDPYTDTSICVARLYAEWQKHPRLVLAVDFDSTVFPWKDDSTHTRVLSLVKKAQEAGFYIVIFTASAPERHQFMMTYLENRYIYVDSINKNPIDLPFGNHGKIYYNLLLDDRAGLGQACDTLEQLLEKIQTKN